MLRKIVGVGLVVALALGSSSAALAGAALPPLAPSHAPLRQSEGHGQYQGELAGCHLRMKKVDFDRGADTVDLRASLACDRRWDRKLIQFTLFWVSKKGEVPNRRQFWMDRERVTFGPASAGRDAATVTLSCAEHANEVTRWRMRAFGLVDNDGTGERPYAAKVERERLDFTC